MDQKVLLVNGLAYALKKMFILIKDDNDNADDDDNDHTLSMISP